MFAAHKKLKKQLATLIEDMLKVDHPTIRSLKEQLNQEIKDWELYTGRRPLKCGGIVIEQPSQGQTIMNAIRIGET